MIISLARRASTLCLLTLALVSLFAFIDPAQAIVRRHDVADQHYLLGAEAYPACVDVIEAGDGIGTLIAPRWLLTAAHVAEVLVQRGQNTLPGPAGPLAIARIVLHPQYSDDTDDMALIELAEPMVGVTPIALYAGDDEVGQEVVFVGRGDTGTGLTGETRSDRRLRTATNLIVSADAHWIVFDFDRPGGPGVTDLEGISGSGDSGGPAFIRQGDRLLLAGISAYQDEGDHRLGQYGVEEFYSRVSRYLPWIREVSGVTPMGGADEDPNGGGAAPGEADGAPDPADESLEVTEDRTEDPDAPTGEPDHRVDAEGQERAMGDDDGPADEGQGGSFAATSDDEASPSVAGDDDAGCDAASGAPLPSATAIALFCLFGLRRGRRRSGSRSA